MILFLCGVPGIGKSTLARELCKDGGLHVEFDQLRLRLGAHRTTDPGVEDAVNWRAFTVGLDALRLGRPLAVFDSTGISKRLPYLRHALGEYPQKLLRLTSAFPYGACARKWGAAYSQDQLAHIAKKVMDLPADIELTIDGRTPAQTAAQIRALL